jgi:hypothetical protein
MARPIPAPPPVTTTPDPSTIVIRAPTISVDQG